MLSSARLPARLAVLAASLLAACATTPPPRIEPQPSLQLAQTLATTPAAADPEPAAPPVSPSAHPPKPAPVTTETLRDDLPPLPTIDLTAAEDNLWQRIRNGFGMPDLDSPLVADRQAYYLNHPDMLHRIIDRSRKYLHHIVDELGKRGMPTELALLPMVESAFNPMATSRTQALGMWQFMPATGKNYKLEQNWWRDERRDIVASTSAALDYLQNVYEMHGDWHLALASYNWGENAVSRAVAKNQAKGLPTDYASLTMPRETQYYVPKLQALKNIIAHPELFGFELEAMPNRPYFDTIALPADMDVAIAAKLAEVPLAEFIALNPAYHRPQMRGDDGSQLVLPADKLETFRANLRRYEAQDKPLTLWRTYTLQKKEKLDRVANRFGISVAHLKQLNGIGPRTKLGAGTRLLVPAPGTQIPDPLVAHLPKMPSEARSATKKVKRSGIKAGQKKAKQAAPGKAQKSRKAKAAASKPRGKPAAKAKVKR